MTLAAQPLVEEFDGLTLVSDPDGTEREDVVQGATRAARTLAGLLVRRPVARALDLGTGCGVLALSMARHAEAVVATDVNPRALEYGRRSAELSGVTNVEWRLGDWYAPVATERFDLIACNPPYVLSPETGLVFRDGAGVTERLVRSAGRHLVPGGLAHFLVNWAHPAGDAGSWVAPLRGWIPEGCDALVVHHASMRPRQYAESWNPPGPGREAVISRWLAWYEAQGIEALGAAFLLLRRRPDDGPPRLQALEATTVPTPRAGVHVERLLRGVDLTSRGDDALLAARLRVAEGVRVEQASRFSGGAWLPERATVRIVPTVGIQALVPVGLLDVVWALDGSGPLREVLAVAPEGRREEGLAAVRRLVELGLVEAVG